MPNIRFLFLIVCVLLIPALHFCSPNQNSGLILATATTGGTYYPVGVGISTITSSHLAESDNISMTAITSAGSGENIQLLINREADLAILQALYGAMAWQGTGLYKDKPVHEVRSLTMLWENVEHFVILEEYVRSGTIADLKNIRSRNFSIGQRGSGTEISGREIIKSTGLLPDSDFDLKYLGYTPSANALQDGRIVGMNIPAGPPASSITQAFAAIGPENLRILEFSDEQLYQVNKTYPVWKRFVIKAGIYPGQEQDINTISQSNLLVVHRSISDEVVYKILRNMFDNLPELRKIHQATQSISLQSAINGLSVPLHPGAVQYYEEQGIDIPAHLLPDNSAH